MADDRHRLQLYVVTKADGAHVHGGQIFPFGLLVRLGYPVAIGLTRIAGGGWLYVSRGTGTWGPPMRVVAAPEITLIEHRS